MYSTNVDVIKCLPAPVMVVMVSLIKYAKSESFHNNTLLS